MCYKKLIILCVSLLFVACQNNELGNIDLDSNTYIRIASPTISVESESRSTTLNELPVGASFGVLGYCVPYMVGTSTPQYNAGSSLWSTKYNQCPTDVFYNEEIKIADGYCTYDNPKLWYSVGLDVNGNSNDGITNVDNYRYSFFAYYPYSDQNSSEKIFTINAPESNTSKGAPRFTFTMPHSGTTVDTPLDHTKTPDAMFGVLYNRTKSQGSLSFTFSHMLTALGFVVNNFSDYVLQINKVTFSGKFYRQISLDFSQTGRLSYSFPDKYYTGTYTLFDKSMNNDQPMILNPPTDGNDRTTSGLLPKGADGNGEYMMLISGKEPYFGPETGNIDNNSEIVHVSIDYVFNGVSGLFHSARPSTFVPQPGTRYTAQLNFVGNAFVLQFVVSDNEKWEDGGSDNDPSSDNEDGNGDIIFE